MQFTDEDFDDINGLYPLVTSGRCKGPQQTVNFAITGPEVRSKLIELKAGPKGRIKVSGGSGSTYNFLRQQFDFSEVETHFQDWSDVEIRGEEQDPNIALITLRDCIPMRVWPRYLAPAAKGL